MRPPVPLHPRKGFTYKTRYRVYVGADGVCGICRKPIDLTAEWDVEHRVPLALGGTNDDDNLEPVHRHPCHAIKTVQDVKAIAKAKRLAGETCTGPGKPIPSRGFAKDGPKRKIPSRPFARRKPKDDA